jgi:hypothetical protein
VSNNVIAQEKLTELVNELDAARSAVFVCATAPALETMSSDTTPQLPQERSLCGDALSFKQLSELLDTTNARYASDFSLRGISSPLPRHLSPL